MDEWGEQGTDAADATNAAEVPDDDGPPTCMDCGEPLEPGFIHDAGFSDSTGALRWVPGQVEMGFWTGRAKLGKQNLVTIEAYRCTGCYRLELYAFPQPDDGAVV